MGEGTKLLPVSPHSGKPQAFLSSGSTSLPAAPRPGSLTTSPFHTHFPSLPPPYPGQWLHSCPPLPSLSSSPLLSSLFSHAPLFSSSLTLTTSSQSAEEKTEARAAGPAQVPQAILCPLTSLSQSLSFFPPHLVLSHHLSLSVCSNLYLSLWLVTLPSPNQACSTCFSHRTVPYPGPPAICPKGSSGGSGWQVAAPLAPFWPGLSP